MQTKVKQEPGAYAYEFQSGKIIELLQKLKDKFVDERGEMERQEANNKHAHSLLLADLKANTEAAKESVTRKSNIASSKRQQSAESKAAYDDAVATLADTEKYYYTLGI